MEITEGVDIKTNIRHFEKRNKLSSIVFTYTMDYDLWKKTFSENLERYKKEELEASIDFCKCSRKKDDVHLSFCIVCGKKIKVKT